MGISAFVYFESEELPRVNGPKFNCSLLIPFLPIQISVGEGLGYCFECVPIENSEDEEKVP